MMFQRNSQTTTISEPTITTHITPENIFYKKNGYFDKIEKSNIDLNRSLNQSLKNKFDKKLLSYIGLNFRGDLKWTNIILITILHIVALYNFLIYHTIEKNQLTTLWGFIVGVACGFGITGGVHRLWSHKAYKAKLPLRIILMLLYITSGQNPIYDWIRDHRVHHKYSESDADPHNANRGFFFAHVGWLMMQKHPEVIRKGKLIDMSDILTDPVIRFQEKYFIPLKIICCFIAPLLVPVYLWNESWYVAAITQCFMRYTLNLNFTWSVNSFAHIFGNRPYDKKIQPAENIGVAIVALGEGWHNYHHVFPWDYKAAELGNYKLNFTTFLLDMFAKIGWAYDLKEPSKELIKKTAEKYGDGTHLIHGHHIPETPPEDTEENFKEK